MTIHISEEKKAEIRADFAQNYKKGSRDFSVRRFAEKYNMCPGTFRALINGKLQPRAGTRISAKLGKRPNTIKNENLMISVIRANPAIGARDIAKLSKLSRNQIVTGLAALLGTHVIYRKRKGAYDHWNYFATGTSAEIPVIKKQVKADENVDEWPITRRFIPQSEWTKQGVSHAE
jgi:hypothetical protein